METYEEIAQKDERENGAKEPMDAAEEVRRRIEAGGASAGDYVELANILELRFLHKQAVDACTKGLEKFPDDPELKRLNGQANHWLDIAEERKRLRMEGE